MVPISECTSFFVIIAKQYDDQKSIIQIEVFL